MPKKRGNGEGSISKRKDGSWCAAVTVGRNANDTPKRKFLYGKTRQDVASKMAKLQSSIMNNKYIEPSSMTLRQWLEIWLWDYKKINVRDTTFGNYEQHIRIHINPVLGAIKLKDLKPSDIQHFYNQKYERGRHDASGGLSAATIKKIHNILSGALEKAVEDRITPYNVSKNTTLPKLIEKEVRALTLNEQNNFMKILLQEPGCLPYIVSLFSGLRRGEILALKWEDVDFKNCTIKIRSNLVRARVFNENRKTTLSTHDPKTKKGNRTIPMPEDVMKILEKYKAQQNLKKCSCKKFVDQGYVFYTETGNPIEPRNYVRKFHLLTSKAGIKDIGVHSLRHTYATRGLEMGIPLQVLTELLGHESITTLVDTYGHALPDAKQGAAEKYNALFNKDSTHSDYNYKE